jgi:hypothetical protein
MSVRFERDSEPAKSFPSDLIGANRLTWSEVSNFYFPLIGGMIRLKYRAISANPCAMVFD